MLQWPPLMTEPPWKMCMLPYVKSNKMRSLPPPNKPLSLMLEALFRFHLSPHTCLGPKLVVRLKRITCAKKHMTHC